MDCILALGNDAQLAEKKLSASQYRSRAEIVRSTIFLYNYEDNDKMNYAG